MSFLHSIIFDTREAKLRDCFSPELPIKVEPLTIGDIIFASDSGSPDCQGGQSLKDVIIFERKSLSDLLASIKDGRYEEQSHRLIHSSGVAPHRIMYIIEGMFSTLRNPAEKQLVISAMTSLQLYKGFSVIRTSSVQETADFIAGMWKKMKRNEEKGVCLYQPVVEQVATQDSAQVAATQVATTQEQATAPVQAYCSVVKKVKKENVTPENIGEIILCQIPGISSTIAVELMTKYKNIRDLLEMIRERPDELKEIKINGRKMGSNVIESILRYLG